MVIIETRIFTRRIKDLMSDDDYRELQETLVNRPDMGNVIKGTGGLRKVRWKRGGSGKSGGVRVIYYWMTEEKQIYMLFVYQKSKQDDLAPEQINSLKTIVERWSDEK